MICADKRANAALLALGLVLTACGGGDAGIANSTGGTPPPAVATESPAFSETALRATDAEANEAESPDVECKDSEGKPTVVKAKTITIHNNTPGTIYPALVTSTNSVNEWLQGCFRIRDLLPTNFAYKLYVNEGAGIPANSSVEITLPLFSQLSGDQYITWWNGGRVLLGDNNEGLRKPEDTRLATPGAVSCKATNTKCKLTTYSSKVGFPENVYAQLSEYTFGDSIEVGGQSTRLLKPENVGYNISYVDHVYLPVAIGPRNNPYIGYSGSTQPITQFRAHLASFLKSATGEG